MRNVESPKDLPWFRNRFAELTPNSPWILGCDLYWVTAEMTAVALDASQDMPEWEPLVECPSPRGLLLWRGQLPLVTISGGHQLQPRGFLWLWNGVIERMSIYVLISMSDLGAAAYGWKGPLPERMIPMAALGGTIELGTDGSVVGYEDDELPERNGIAALVGATWHLMQQPKVAETREVRPGRRDVEMSARLQGSYPLVTTVDLRLLRHSSDAEPGASGRRLTVRHMVRGHWRQQYHPSDGSRRPQWIAPYVKGDSSLPLHLTETVQVWRR